MDSDQQFEFKGKDGTTKKFIGDYYMKLRFQKAYEGGLTEEEQADYDNYIEPVDDIPQ